MPRKLVNGKRSPGSREFGVKLTLPQIKIVLKLISAVCDSTPIVWESRELDSVDSLENRMKGLYRSITGEGVDDEREYGVDPRRMSRAAPTIERHLDIVG